MAENAVGGINLEKQSAATGQPDRTRCPVAAIFGYLVDGAVVGKVSGLMLVDGRLLVPPGVLRPRESFMSRFILAVLHSGRHAGRGEWWADRWLWIRRPRRLICIPGC